MVACWWKLFDSQTVFTEGVTAVSGVIRTFCFENRWVLWASGYQHGKVGQGNWDIQLN